MWPEIETTLANTDWYARNVSGVPPIRGIDPHHLTYARRALVEVGHLVPDAATLNAVSVLAYLDAQGLAARRETAIRRLAASKRRLYRTYLGWTSDPRHCGQILERQVAATLDRIRGYDVLLDPAPPGRVSTIADRPVPGGPLDHAGYLTIDPADPTRGLIGFLVEDKNVRSTLYPSAQEVWDLLAKAGGFPTHVPLLITHRVHYTLLTFFKAIGAVAYTSNIHWFSPELDPTDFRKVAIGLKFAEARQLRYPDRPSDAITRFFTATLRGPNTADPKKPMIEAYADRWRIAAPICASYAKLRQELESDKRTELFQQALEVLEEAGLDVGELRAHHRLEEDENVDIRELDYVDYEPDLDDIEE